MLILAAVWDAMFDRCDDDGWDSPLGVGLHYYTRAVYADVLAPLEDWPEFLMALNDVYPANKSPPWQWTALDSWPNALRTHEHQLEERRRADAKVVTISRPSKSDGT